MPLSPKLPLPYRFVNGKFAWNSRLSLELYNSRLYHSLWFVLVVSGGNYSLWICSSCSFTCPFILSISDPYTFLCFQTHFNSWSSVSLVACRNIRVLLHRGTLSPQANHEPGWSASVESPTFIFIFHVSATSAPSVILGRFMPLWQGALHITFTVCGLYPDECVCWNKGLPLAGVRDWYR
jgi:hypothetical protein